MEEQALIPVAQTDITVAGFPITVVLLPDGQTGAVFVMFCEALDLQTHYQLHRIHHDPVLLNKLFSFPTHPERQNVS